MNKIDNFELLNSLIEKEFVSEDVFFLGEIITRKKENPEQTKSAKIVETIFLKKVDSLMRKKDYIIKICNAINARFYLYINPRSHKRVTLEMAHRLTDMIRREEFLCNLQIAEKMAGKTPNGRKYWVVDIDTQSKEDQKLIEESISDCLPDVGQSKVILRIPTKNGIHLITKPFDKKDFFAKVGLENIELSVFDNSPTLVYIGS